MPSLASCTAVYSLPEPPRLTQPFEIHPLWCLDTPQYSVFIENRSKLTVASGCPKYTRLVNLQKWGSP